MNQKRRNEEIRRLMSFGYNMEEIEEYLNPKPFVAKNQNFPAQDCEGGYSWPYLEEIMDAETFAAFSKWMNGQTCMICDGRRYSHEDKQYYPTECADNPHGGVAYKWDVHRFLEIIPGKEIWD